MSNIKIQGNASGTGTLTIAAPNTNTDRTLTLPDAAGSFVTADASGNVGIDTTPNTWAGSYAALEIGTSGTIYSRTDTQEVIGIASNSYYDGSSNKYKIAGEAARMYFVDGWLNVDTASAGSAGGTVTYTSNLVLKAGGDLQFNSGYGSVATAYGVRAWISLNGNGSGAIHGSGGVSSYVRNGVGDYDINFSFTMPDASYAVASIGTEERVDRNVAWQSASTTKLTVVYETTGGGRVDGSPISVIVVR